MMIEKDKCVYTKCYCEENIYMLCKQIDENYPEMLDKFTVVFISNDERKVSFVICIQKGNTNLCIVDTNVGTEIMCG